VLGSWPVVAIVPSPSRTIGLDVLVALQRAIRERSALRVMYQSLSRAEPNLRTLTPHAMAHDGFRWHVRAYCHARKAFRDFVIARMLKVHGKAPAGLGPEADADWNDLVTLVLAPHPQLNGAHRRAIELDYGMSKGRVELRCRKALLFYVLRHLRLDGRSASTPEAQQIVLKNQAQVERLLS
jgi:predicted DNA-binding transcriptional regulator YafY